MSVAIIHEHFGFYITKCDRSQFYCFVVVFFNPLQAGFAAEGADSRTQFPEINLQENVCLMSIFLDVYCKVVDFCRISKYNNAQFELMFTEELFICLCFASVYKCVRNIHPFIQPH